jgi:hypothetical protein
MMSTAHDKDMETERKDKRKKEIKFYVFSAPKVWVGWILVTMYDHK